MDVSRFAERVYAACKHIPRGKVSTYGELARHLGSSPRAVGQALKKNPYAPHVPCHRIVSTTGTIGGFQGRTTGAPITKKIELLLKEGVRIVDKKIDLSLFFYTFT